MKKKWLFMVVGLVAILATVVVPSVDVDARELGWLAEAFEGSEKSNDGWNLHDQ